MGDSVCGSRLPPPREHGRLEARAVARHPDRFVFREAPLAFEWV